MPFSKIWIHAIWSVRDRQPLLNDNIRPLVLKHIIEYCEQKNISIDSIGGWREHAHALVSMDTLHSFAQIMQAIKGESSHWINANNLSLKKFEWQDDYFALSIAHSQLEVFRNYIKNQEIYHSKISFDEEYLKVFQKYNFESEKG